MTFGLLLLAAYLLGAIPFGVLVARARGVDILKAGSGNIGATNVGRVLGKGPGLAVWGLDVLKSLAPTLAARASLHVPLGGLDPQTQWFLVGAAAILGHCASPFLGFRGGKGISTALGAVVGAAPLVALPCFALFALVLATVRYMAIASTVGVLSVVLFGWLLGVTPQLLPVFLLLGLFVAYRHRTNFRRLREGTEPKFSFKMAGAPPEVPSSSSRGETPANDSPPSGDGKGGGDRLRLEGNPQLPNPYEGYGTPTVQIVDSILDQLLDKGDRLEMAYDAEALRITIDDRDNGQLPLGIATETLRRLALIAGMDPLKATQPRSGTIRGTYDGETFALRAEAFPTNEGVVFTLAREV